MSNPDSAMNLKFSKKEKIALIGLSALLIGYGIYQTAYGTGQGKDEFVNCQDFDADCNSAPDDCQAPVTTYVKNGTYYAPVERHDIVTNTTACIDGYSHGWEHSCQTDGKACVFLFKSYGFLPDGSIIRKGNGTTTVCDVGRVSCGGTDIPTNGTIHWHYDARAGWFG